MVLARPSKHYDGAIDKKNGSDRQLLGELILRIEYLFLPDQISEIINRHSCLKGKIDDPSKDGTPSSSFPAARKTYREIYRVLCNQHYPHLQEFLYDLEYCLNNGWQQPTILKTRSGREFHSAISELTVASHFAKIGFDITSFDEKKSQKLVPDLMIKSSFLSCLGEVYSPRNWDGIQYFKDDLRLSLLHLDIPWDFDFEITFEPAHNFDEKGNLLRFDPWQFSDCYVNPTRRSDQIIPVLHELTNMIQNSNNKKLSKKLVDEANNTVVDIIIHQIEPSKYELPVRHGVIHGPSLSGYSPECMFDKLIQRRIRSKINKRQTEAIHSSDLKVLFVDVSHLGYISEFNHSYYQGKFAESIEKHFGADFSGIDAVIFFQPIRSHEKSFEVPLLFKRPIISLDRMRSLIGSGWKANEVNGTVVVKEES